MSEEAMYGIAMEDLLPDGCSIATLERQLATREEQKTILYQQCVLLNSQLQERRERCDREAYEACLGGPTLVEEFSASASQPTNLHSISLGRRGTAQPRQDANTASSRTVMPKRAKSTMASSDRRRTPLATSRRTSPVPSQLSASEVMPCLRGKAFVRRSVEPAGRGVQATLQPSMCDGNLSKALRPATEPVLGPSDQILYIDPSVPQDVDASAEAQESLPLQPCDGLEDGAVAESGCTVQ